MAALPDLVVVPGGTLLMGSLDGRDDERPVHQVPIASFRMGRTQVANAEYDAFVRATGRAEAPFRRKPGFDRPEQPVVAVSWFDAEAYCEWLADRTGRLYRLPTEAEWEWAARGGQAGARYPWGEEAPSKRAPDYERLWLTGPEPIGLHLSNGYGLFEMCENVHEWCADWYDATRYARPGGETPPTGRRSSRGGSWRHQVKVSTCANRSSIPPGFQYADYGFRVAG